ncbi:hypothetical protein GUJ93_ZPchr0005g15372 [Zizania palustris]|uniref:Thioredoxin-like fold domain-containing protein n=1 Tax=Zizania palustris TaxID=103762 RepID=A0A8J5SPN9_ZIZPA|nr:hypothetical protein GUJ93_ZPchr0005g15372 [Zizania palustris]
MTSLRCCSSTLPATCSAICLGEAALPARSASLVRCPASRPRVAARRLMLARCAPASDSKAVQLVLSGRARNDDSESSDGEDEPEEMTDAERRTLRRKIREMMDRVPETRELTDPEERKAKMRELLTKYQLVVEEEDPNWPEDAEDGMGFSLDQFFDKITINAEKMDDDDDESDNKKIVWEDDNYIQPIRDVKTKDWDATVFTDFGPLIVLVHNRYKRPQDNETARDQLVMAIETFWEHNLPSPRCVAVDACAEPDLVEVLNVSGFPEVLFTNAGRIIHRDKGISMSHRGIMLLCF